MQGGLFELTEDAITGAEVRGKRTVFDRIALKWRECYRFIYSAG